MAKKLIYIVGAGRSGTTILDIMLGNNSNTMSLGEINRYYKRAGIPPKRESNSQTSNFWAAVRSDLENKGHKDYPNLNKLFRKNEYHSFFFKSLLKLNNKSYKNYLKDMYEVLYNHLDEEVIIESSKYPSRALNLSSYLRPTEIEVSYVYLKKNPVSVVESFQKEDLEQPKKSFIAANLYYFIVNILCSITKFVLKLRGHKTITIKFEDLMNSPERHLQAFQSKFNIDLTEAIQKINNNQPLETGRLFDGNRIRLKDRINLKNQKKELDKTFNYYFTRVFNYIVYS